MTRMTRSLSALVLATLCSAPLLMAADAVTVDGTGKVGINNNAPAQQLDVVGDTKITGNLTVTGAITGTGIASNYILIKDIQPSGTMSGTFTSGAWRTRTLNTIEINIGNYASLSSNQVTLTPGTYRCRLSAPAYEVGDHQVRLYNVTDASVLALGQQAVGSGGCRSEAIGRFTISTPKVLEIQHRCEATKANNGLGTTLSWSNVTFAVLELWRE